MVEQSELAFRALCREYGCDIAVTPMLHARMMVESASYLPMNFTTNATDRPLIAQFAGHEPATLLAACKLVQDRVDAVDLNLGCPQGIARRGRYGAFLLEETDLLVSIVSSLHAGLDVPVTCKIRMLPTLEATLKLAKTLEAAGASMLTVHGRTKENMKQSITAVDWDAIKAIKQAVSIPVIANGGIGCLADVDACLKATGCDGVMSSEALLENPGLFSDNIPTSGPLYDAAIAAGVQPVRSDQFVLAQRYLDLAEASGAGWSSIKPHCFKMLFGVWRVMPDLRDRLSEQCKKVDTVRDIVREAEARYHAIWAPQIAAVLSDPTSQQRQLVDVAQAQWLEASKGQPNCAWSNPAYLIDPAVGGSWYMRYRPDAYAGKKAPDDRNSWIKQQDAATATQPEASPAAGCELAGTTTEAAGCW